KAEEAIVNEIYGARIFSPGGIELSVKKNKPVALVVDRFKFDRYLYKKAIQQGIEISLDTKLIDIRKSSLFLEKKGHGELCKSQVIVGADGAGSLVRHVIAPEISRENFLHAFQIRAQGVFNPKIVELHFCEFAKGFFAWIIPENNRIARIGLAVKMGKNPAENLKRFIEKKGLALDVLHKSSGLIPIGKPLKKLAQGNILLAGDAGFQTKASTGGGLILGLKAAKVCSETIANHLKHKTSLAEYDKNLGEINKELGMHWKIYSYIHSLEPKKIDDFFGKAKRAGIEEFLEEHGDMDAPSTFVGKIVKSPRMWALLPQALRFI
ncbi:MAG: hypothetical protein JW772_02875, partial [Candidatus Diapherotrites archaeon]|nr:hypothetical protein [Candidatus Diapherotrites archaeon]